MRHQADNTSSDRVSRVTFFSQGNQIGPPGYDFVPGCTLSDFNHYLDTYEDTIFCFLSARDNPAMSSEDVEFVAGFLNDNPSFGAVYTDIFTNNQRTIIDYYPFFQHQTITRKILNIPFFYKPTDKIKPHFDTQFEYLGFNDFLQGLLGKSMLYHHAKPLFIQHSDNPQLFINDLKISQEKHASC